MNILKSLFCFSLVILFQGTIWAQDWVSFQSPEQINDLIETDDELMMATDAGLVTINKTTLERTILNTANSNLANNHIQSIAKAPNGDTYIGTYDIIMARVDDSGFQDTISPNVEGITPFTILYDFEIAANGDFWLGTSDGVLHKQGENWTLYDEDELGISFVEVWDIEFTSEGEVLAAANDIHKFSDGVWSNISDTTQLSAYNSADLFFSNSGDLYFAGDLDRIGRFDGNQWYEYDNGGLNGSQVVGFTEDSDGVVYFNTTNDGIFKFENDAWVTLSDIQTNEYDENVAFFHIDEQNRYWVNNNIYLSIIENGNIQSTTISDQSIEYDYISKIRKAPNGDLLFLTSTSTNSIAVLDTEGNWSALQLPDNLALWPTTGDILMLATDDIWLGTWEGLYHYNGTEWMLTELEPCRDLKMDTQGKIYARANDRVYIVENGVVSEYNPSNSALSDLIISGIGIDETNNLWIASFEYNGEAMIQKVDADGNWTTFTNTDHAIIDQPIGDFHFDQSGNVWVPSGFSGAMKYDGTYWTNPLIENSNAIANTDVFAIESDAEGKIFFAHQYGVTTFFDGAWNNLLIEEVPNIASSQNSDIEFDDDGTLWWGSYQNGIFAYTPGSTTSTLSRHYEAVSDWSVYPNPAKDFFTIDFSTEAANTEATLYIYNDLGQLLKNINLGQLPAGKFQQTLQIADFANGIYSIQLKLNNIYFTRRMIIQK